MRLTFFAFAWAFVASGSFPSTGHAQAPECVGRELSRYRLVVEGGRELYVEPSVVAVSGSSTLLAGKPSYLFLKRDPGATAELESRDTIFGALIEADGSARIVPAPPVTGRMVAAVAGIGTGSGAWRVIFAELDSIGGANPQVDAFWHGVYDGRRWSELERLPQPPGKPLLYFNTSPLAQSADTVVWAALADVGRSMQGVVVFERHGGVWSHQLLATPFASGVEALASQALGFVLAITHSDADAARGQSVFLYTRPSGWTLHRKLSLVDTDGGALDSSSETGGRTSSGDSRTLSLRFGPLPTSLGNREEPLIAVSPLFGAGFATVALGDGTILWATESADSSGARELRLVRPLTDSTEIVWRSPSPFRGPFTAVAHSASDALIVGPELDEAHAVLVSLILRIGVACEQGRKTGG